MPKPNMYQSLHTTVFGLDGYLFEIQIRTYDMDKIAEYGIASHWSYKEQKDGGKATKDSTEQKLQIFRNIIELNEDSGSSEEFVSSVKKDILSRINRANSIKPWVSEETYIFYLEKDEVFKALSCSVKSQLRKAVKLYSQFRDEIKREA